MKRGLLILAAALLAGLAGFVIMRGRYGCGMTCPTTTHGSHAGLPELDWLRREFKLSDEQFARVSALHLAYRPTCEALCEKIMISQEKIARLVRAEQGVSTELKAALQEHALLRMDCQMAMLTHLYQTAACLPPEQARHYLDELLPQLLEMPMPSTSPPSPP